MLNLTTLRFEVGALLIVALTAGCHGSPTMVQVRGKVLYKDGTPLKGGVRVIRFEPARDTSVEGLRVASGQIEEDGSYHLFTRKPGDGIMPGTYNVTFTDWKGPHDPVSLIPEKYTGSVASPFKNVKIDRDEDGKDFQIESMQGAGASPSATAETPSQAH